MSEIQRVEVSMGGFDVNVYIVHAPEGDLIVDAGAEPEKILAATNQPVAAILITHGHADHIAGEVLATDFQVTTEALDGADVHEVVKGVNATVVKQ